MNETSSPVLARYPILFLGSQMAVAGAQRVLLDQAGWFHEHGYPVTAAFFYDKEGMHARWQSEVPFPLVNLDSWRPGAGLPNLLRLLRGIARLVRLLRSEKFTVVETFTHHTNLLGIPAARLAGVPVRVATHHGRIDRFPAWMERLHTWIINAGVATCLVAVSERTRKIAVEDEGVQAAQVQVIANGIHFPGEAEASPEEKSAFRRELGVSPGGKVLLTTGRLRDQKGHIHLVHAAPQVLARCPDTVFVLAGEGPLRGMLQEQAQRLGVASAFRFLGVRQDVPRLLRLADGFVLPSLWEGLPLALLEAMYAGLPLVATDVEGVADVIEPGVNGLLVPPGDSQALAAAILRLLSDPGLCARLGSAAQQLVKEQYTLESMCQKYETLFNEVMA